MALGLAFVAASPAGALPLPALTSASAVKSVVPGQVLERRRLFGFLGKIFKKRPKKPAKKTEKKKETKDKEEKKDEKKPEDKKPVTPAPSKPIDNNADDNKSDTPPPQAKQGSNVKGAVISGAAGTLPMAGMMMMPMGGSSGSSSPDALPADVSA
ncbi:hypothetical protein H4R35_007324 [Dimargaris xerosporica]|nr:hypothetical protein H4R35_007324 [Dimargaris xerosporica]